MRARIDAAFAQKAIIDRVVGDLCNRRAVDWSERAGQIIVNDISDAIDAAGADDIEELLSEFREKRAYAPAGNDRRSTASEMIGELPQSIEVGLKPREEYEVVLVAMCRVEWAVPVFMIKHDIKSLCIDQCSNMQTCDRLHEMRRAPFVATRPKMGANDDRFDRLWCAGTGFG
ncbi:hypothetical protein AB4Z40_26310 [Bosea sp. 2YAB26]|uniref:hypothetical protein n=1 Tax=unclassified Bosea (in: a-proteobacteria) TaxID=2653178 RepID=UPI003F9007E6